MTARRMMAGAAAALAVAALGGSAARAQPQPDDGHARPKSPPARVITQPDWLQKPTGESLAEHYPPAANELGIEGQATIGCQVDAAGRLADCRILEEGPKDLGFGQAVLAMSGDFQMKPQTINGEPVTGGTVKIPVMFRLPSPEPAGQPPEPSPSALTQAEKLVDVVGASEQAMSAYRERANRIETQAEGSASGAARAGAAAALREAAEKHRGDFRAAFARAYAAVYSEDQMAEMAAFHSRYGKLINDPEMQTLEAGALAASLLDLRNAGHALFCAKHDCGGPQDIQRVWRRTDTRGRLDDPQWLRVPDASELAAAGPEVVQLLGVSGVARLACAQGKDGALESCAIEDEAPAGMGYGHAALKLTDGFTLSSLQSQPAAGTKVTVRIGFPPPQLGTTYKPPGPASAQALALGRRIVAASEIEKASRLQMELQIAGLESKMPPGSERKVYEDAIAAYRAGLDKALAAFMERGAQAWAARHSEAQLSAIAAYYESPTGKAEVERVSALKVAYVNVQQPVAEKVTADARAIYCATHDCAGLIPAQPASTAVKPAASTAKP